MIVKQFEERSKEVVSWLEREYMGIRSGQATPALLDSIRVSSYGTLVPLNQVGSVNVEDARTLRVSLWDTSQVSAVETAIRDADLGLSVVTDSSGLRVIFPELSSERRTQLLKLAKSKLEDARVSLRSARDEVMKLLEKQEKAGDISEDEKFTLKESLQKVVEATNRTLDVLFQKKEVEISS
jgi:ribosome recycling factor